VTLSEKLNSHYNARKKQTKEIYKTGINVVVIIIIMIIIFLVFIQTYVPSPPTASESNHSVPQLVVLLQGLPW